MYQRLKILPGKELPRENGGTHIRLQQSRVQTLLLLPRWPILYVTTPHTIGQRRARARLNAHLLQTPSFLVTLIKNLGEGRWLPEPRANAFFNSD